MPGIKIALWLVTAAFVSFSLWVLMQIGYFGIWQGGFASLGSTQITLDLIIACTLVMGFIARDCRARGRAWWPWALMTLVLGSIGPLVYLLWPKR
jgi:hypothetical protein